MSFRRKSIRLPAQNYIGRRVFFVTICCENRRPTFATEPAGRWLLDHLIPVAAQHAFSIHAYCVMPDHLHILVEGMNDNCDLKDFVSALKQRTAFDYRKQHSSSLWQTRYYDHALRKPGDVESVAWYIWLNPVRQGLCTAPQEYPLSGSQTVDLHSRCAPAHLWSPPWKTTTPAWFWRGPALPLLL